MPVYVNRTLNLKRIKYIGLDMDHTLVKYKSENFEELAYEFTLKILVSHFHYPESILDLKFDYNRVVRGLIMDKNGGNLLKISCFGSVRSGYHGLYPIDFNADGDIGKHQYIDLGDPQFDPVDTTFSISCATLFAQLVDLKDKDERLKLPKYRQLADDIILALDKVHQNDSLKKIVSNDLDKFIIRDEKVVSGIEKFLKHGKKIFIITNSDYNYTNTLLDYTITPFLKEHKRWIDIFEYVLTNSNKPRFFYDKMPFLKIDPETGFMTNTVGSFGPGLYQGGCAEMLTRELELHPNEVLYIGDHIYSDILRLKKSCAWRTGLVIEELENEVATGHKVAEIKNEITRQMGRKVRLETQTDELISKQIESDTPIDSKQMNQLFAEINKVNERLALLAKKELRSFNPYWGEVMRVGVEESYFAYQLQKYSCIYMGRISDFFSISPRSYFRSRKRPLAHDP